MDARAYYELAASIDEATTVAALAAVRERAARTDLLAPERIALAHLLRAREHALRFRARLRGDDPGAGAPAASPAWPAPDATGIVPRFDERSIPPQIHPAPAQKPLMPKHREQPTPPRPEPADVGRAVRAALVAGASPAELRGIVCDYVRALKRAGLPPEQALKRVKAVVGVPTVTPLPERGLSPADRLAGDVVEWFVAEYYRAD